MRRLRRWIFPITTSLVAVALAAAVVLAIDDATKGIEDERSQRRADLAETIAGGVQNWLAQTRLQASAIASELEPWTGASSQLARAPSNLDSSLSSAPRFDLGGYVVQEDRVVATSSTAAYALALKRDFSWISAALAGRGTVSPIYQDPSTHALRIDAAVPLENSSGEVGGALILGISAVGGSLNEVVSNLASDPDEITTYVVSPSSHALSSDQSIGVARDHPNAGPAVQVLDGLDPALATGFGAFEGEGRVEQTVGFSRTEGWTVLLIQPSEDFFIYGSSLSERLLSDTPTRNGAIGALALLIPLLTLLGIWNSRLRAAQVRADEISRAFLAITGHELRTPLTSLRGYSQMLLSRWDSLKDEQKKDLMGTISRNARTLEHLIERLLLGGQLEAGVANRPMITEVDAVKLLKDATEQFDGLSKLHEVTLEAPEQLMVSADPKALGQVLSHILENAIKYSPSGGRVWVAAEQAGRWTRIVIEDEGVGLPADTSRMFEKFGQAEDVNTRTVEEGGVGLGLFIVRKHLEAMGGTVSAERREPAGARFIVELRSA